MSKEDIQDLKQFILATISQSESSLEKRLSARIAVTENKIDQLRQDMEAGFQGVADAFEALHSTSF